MRYFLFLLVVGFFSCHSEVKTDEIKNVITKANNSEFQDFDKSTKAVQIIRRVKEILQINDTLLTGDDVEFIYCQTDLKVYLIRCLRRDNKWHGKYYRVFADENGFIIDSSLIVPKSGWPTFIDSINQLDILHLPTDKEYLNEIRKPNNEGRPYGIIDGSDSYFEIRTKDKVIYRHYNNIWDHTKARKSSKVLNRINELYGLIYREIMVQI